jgi:lysophospholipase L1-like esterase
MYERSLMPGEATTTEGWRRLAAILERGTCLKIAVLGGSNTCKQHSFANTLQPYMNAAFPCTSEPSAAWKSPLPQVFPPVPANSSAVFNLCLGGMGSAHWVSELSWVLANAAQNVTLAQQLVKPATYDDGVRASFEARLLLADLVVVETSVNDMRRWCCEPGCYDAVYAENAQLSQRDMEILARQLNALPGSPAVMVTGIVSICLNWNGTETEPERRWNHPRTSDMLDAQHKVLRHYAVPVVSPLDGLAAHSPPLPDSWFQESYRSAYDGKPDSVHVSNDGHALIARFIVNAVGEQARAAPSAALVIPSQVPPRAASRHAIDIHLHAIPLVFDLHERARTWLTHQRDNGSAWPAVLPAVSSTAGWQFMADVPLKEGLVSTSVGDAFTFLVTPAERRKFCRFGVLALELLKSYRHMGVLNISILALAAHGDGCAALPASGTAVELAASQINCSWDLHESVGVIEEMRLPSAPRELCLAVTLSNAAAAGKGASGGGSMEAEHKLKLYTVTLI